jgi:pectinesterase
MFQFQQRVAHSFGVFLAIGVAAGLSACAGPGNPLRPPEEGEMPAGELPGAEPGASADALPVEPGAGGDGEATPPAVAPGESGEGMLVGALEPVPPATPPSDQAEVVPPAGQPGDPGVLLGTPQRPLLAPAAADGFDVLDYLAAAGSLSTGLTRDDWDPTAGVGDVRTFTPDFLVAATGGTQTSVQAAITAAVTAGGSARRFIEVQPGTYREVVCVPNGAPPITLYSTDPDASLTQIVFNNNSGKVKAAGVAANPCNANLTGTTYGTSGSATFAAYANEFQAKNLSFVNDTNEATATGGLQAVALMTQGDRVLFENVRVLGNQDTLFAKTPDTNTVRRAYFKDCFVEGDTDFIFGRASFVLDGCTIRSLTSRTAGGVVAAPSTDARHPFGILIIRSSFIGDATAGASSTHLGRAWDESQVDVATYTTNVLSGAYPNGQALVRDSTLGPHIQSAGPWRSAATTDRPYASVASATVPANRMYEFDNTLAGAAGDASLTP